MPRPVRPDPVDIRASLGLAPVTITAPHQRVAYGDHVNQFGELFLPTGAGRVPVVVVIHGGAWRDRFDLSLGTPLAADLVEHGVAAWNIEYRRVGGGGGWPATFFDVASAIDALATVCQEASGGRLDLSRVVALGHSSGGHLAAWAASRHRLASNAPGAAPAVAVKAAVSQSGVLDLLDASEKGLVSGAIDDLMGTRDAEAFSCASPIELLPIGVPVVCVHGDLDPTVPADQSERYVAAAMAAGDPAQLVVLPGVGHFEVIDPGSAAWARCRQAVLSLLSG